MGAGEHQKAYGGGDLLKMGGWLGWEFLFIMHISGFFDLMQHKLSLDDILLVRGVGAVGF